uniref:Uncharacterized protein n=1 Tax=Setaria italica TaxID=4555 RepID=K3ZYJ2_SETIT
MEKNRSNELLWNKLIHTHSTYIEFTISPFYFYKVFDFCFELSWNYHLILSIHDRTVDAGRSSSQPAYGEHNHLAQQAKQPPVSYRRP